MSVSIEVSFTEERELLAVTEKFENWPLKVSKQYKGGRFTRVYLRGEVPRACDESTDDDKTE